MKNTDSDVFSEAYFIVDDNGPARDLGESDMIREANRIIDESLARTLPEGGGRGKFSRVTGAILKSVPAFCLGALVATLVCILLI